MPNTVKYIEQKYIWKKKPFEMDGYMFVCLFVCVLFIF